MKHKGHKKSTYNAQSFVNFFSSKNCPRNVRQPTRCRAGEFFRDEKKLGQKHRDARNEFLPRNEYYTSGVLRPTNFMERSGIKFTFV